MHLENLFLTFITIFHKKNFTQMEIQSKFRCAPSYLASETNACK